MRAVAAGVGYGVVITARGRKAMASLYAARVFRVNVPGRIQLSTRAAEEGVALGSPEGVVSERRRTARLREQRGDGDGRGRRADRRDRARRSEALHRHVTPAVRRGDVGA